MLKFLIAVDDSDHARRAVEAVGRLAAQSQGVEVVLVNVRELSIHFGELTPQDYGSIEEEDVRRQTRLLEAALTKARNCGVERVTAEAAMGAPASEIVKLAEQQAVDQIVLGTHGRGPIGSLFIGSVAQRVVHLSKLPVLLVK